MNNEIIAIIIVLLFIWTIISVLMQLEYEHWQRDDWSLKQKFAFNTVFVMGILVQSFFRYIIVLPILFIWRKLLK